MAKVTAKAAAEKYGKSMSAVGSTQHWAARDLLAGVAWRRRQGRKAKPRK